MNANFAQIRDQLEHRRSELLHRRDRIGRDLGRVDGALSQDFSEQAVEVQNDEALNEIARAAAAEIGAIDAALERLVSGKYGFCAQCGEPIDERRLVAMPHSVTCTHCGPRTRQ